MGKIEHIHFVSGDILSPPKEILDFPSMTVIPVNCEGIMGAGLAKQFAVKFPEGAKLYKEACDKGELGIGKTFPICIGNGRWFLFFPTKRSWRENSTIEAITLGMADWYNECHYGRAALFPTLFPKIGCGCGKLDWNTVWSIMLPFILYSNQEAYIYS